MALVSVLEWLPEETKVIFIYDVACQYKLNLKLVSHVHSVIYGHPVVEDNASPFHY